MTDNKVIEIKQSKIGRGKAGGMTVLAPKGSLTYQNNYEELEILFNECTDQHRTKIILDCKDMSFVDSAGLELLARVDEKLRRRGGILKVVCLNDICRDIFVVTRLINTLAVYKDIHEAIRNGP